MTYYYSHNKTAYLRLDKYPDTLKVSGFIVFAFC